MKKNENLPICIKNIPIDVQLAKELKTLSEDIQNEKDELESILEDIESNTCSIEIKRNWGFIKKSSIEDACKDIYKNLSGYIKDCSVSIQKTNENLGRSLELIKLLAIVEKDLYEQIDDQIVRSNEFNESFLDWCKQQGINDEEVRGLLETSFHRAYTLRDRINTLRNSLMELDGRVGKLEQKANSFDNIVEEKKRAFENIYKEKYDAFIKLVDEKKKDINETHKQFRQTIGEKEQELQRRIDNVEKSILEIDGKIKRFNEKVQETKEGLQSFAKEKQEDLDKIKTDTKNDLNKFVNLEKENIANICRENGDEIKRIIQVYENKLENERDVLKKEFNKKIVYAIFGSVVLSSLISYLVTMLWC